MRMTSVVPFIAMVVVQFSYAGMNITSKLAIESCMNPLVLVAYRQIFATLSLAPFAYWFEGQEYLSKTKVGTAKILGTLLSMGGALILSIFQWKVLDLGESKIHWGYAIKLNEATSGGGSTRLLGPLFVIVSTLAWALWFVVQVSAHG